MSRKIVSYNSKVVRISGGLLGWSQQPPQPSTIDSEFFAAVEFSISVPETTFPIRNYQLDPLERLDDLEIDFTPVLSLIDPSEIESYSIHIDSFTVHNNSLIAQIAIYGDWDTYSYLIEYNLLTNTFNQILDIISERIINYDYRIYDNKLYTLAYDLDGAADFRDIVVFDLNDFSQPITRERIFEDLTWDFPPYEYRFINITDSHINITITETGATRQELEVYTRNNLTFVKNMAFGNHTGDNLIIASRIFINDSLYILRRGTSSHICELNMTTENVVNIPLGATQYRAMDIKGDKAYMLRPGTPLRFDSISVPLSVDDRQLVDTGISTITFIDTILHNTSELIVILGALANSNEQIVTYNPLTNDNSILATGLFAAGTPSYRISFK